MNYKKISIIAGIILVFAIIFVYYQFYICKKSTNLPAPKVVVNSANDGEIYATIFQINSNPEDTIITLKHVTYFSGTEAFSSVDKEVKCDKASIVECVPTLNNGYYVRESRSPTLIIPLAKDVEILLSSSKPSLSSLADLTKENSISLYNPVFKVNIKNGVAISVEEITRYNRTISGGIPKGYVFDSYKVEKTSAISCKMDSECKTPTEYLIRSNCPFTSICEQNKCIVICPDYK